MGGTCCLLLSGEGYVLYGALILRVTHSRPRLPCISQWKKEVLYKHHELKEKGPKCPLSRPAVCFHLASLASLWWVGFPHPPPSALFLAPTRSSSFPKPLSRCILQHPFASRTERRTGRSRRTAHPSLHWNILRRKYYITCIEELSMYRYVVRLYSEWHYLYRTPVEMSPSFKELLMMFVFFAPPWLPILV